VHFLKHILSRYTVFIWGLLKPLGMWGAFGIAVVDAGFLGMPLDAVVAGYVYELLLRKRLSGPRFGKIRASFEKREFWALMVPSMLPPPAPFKIFVLSAGVFKMHFTQFLAAIFCGRMVRFLVLSVLTLFFGPQVISFAGLLLHKHPAITLGSGAVVIVLIYVIYRLWRQPVVDLEHELEKKA